MARGACPYKHGGQCNRGCRGFQCRYREENRKDLLNMEYINGLPQPFIAVLWSKSQWPVHDIDVEFGLVRLDVCGLLDRTPISDIVSFIDALGITHNADDFYL